MKYIETIYYPYNFLHLTGLEYNPKNFKIKSKYNKSIDFYQNLLRSKIPENSINFKNSITTKLKLQVLHNLCNIDRTAKFIGNYDNTIKDNLYTEKVIGNSTYCLGFVKDKKTGYYIPNSAINDIIKNISYNILNVYVVLKKKRYEKLYKSFTYIKKGIDLKETFKKIDLCNIIDFGNIEYSNKDDIKNTNKVEELRNVFNDENENFNIF